MYQNDAKVPLDILASVTKTAKSKAAEGLDQLFWSGLLGGMFVAVGAFVSVIIAGSLPGLKATNPGMQKLVWGALFPIGPMMVTLSGTLMFTPFIFIMAYGTFHKKSTAKGLLKIWSVSWVMNTLGSLFVSYCLIYQIYDDTEIWVAEIREMTTQKLNQRYVPLFASGICCTLILSLGAYFHSAATDVISRLLGIWWPTMSFVSVGFEHSVANMFYCTLGMVYGAENTNVWKYLRHSFFVSMGNIVGGSFVAFVLWYSHHFRKDRSLWSLVKNLYTRWRNRKNKKETETPLDITIRKDEVAGIQKGDQEDREDGDEDDDPHSQPEMVEMEELGPQQSDLITTRHSFRVKTIIAKPRGED